MCLAPEPAGTGQKSIQKMTNLWFGHDFDPVTYRCRRCGLGEVEYIESQKVKEQYDRYGNLVGRVYYGGIECPKDDFH